MGPGERLRISHRRQLNRIEIRFGAGKISRGMEENEGTGREVPSDSICCLSDEPVIWNITDSRSESIKIAKRVPNFGDGQPGWIANFGASFKLRCMVSLGVCGMSENVSTTIR